MKENSSKNEKIISKIQHALGEGVMNVFYENYDFTMSVNDKLQLIYTDNSDSLESCEVIRKLTVEEINSVILEMAEYLSIKDTEECPIIEGNMPEDTFNRSYFVGVLEPISKNPTFSITKNKKEPLSLFSYVEENLITKNDYNKIVEVLKNNGNMIIMGQSTSGKSTLLNALLAEKNKHTVKTYPEKVALLQNENEKIEYESEFVNTFVTRFTQHFDMDKVFKLALKFKPKIVYIDELSPNVLVETLKLFSEKQLNGIFTLFNPFDKDNITISSLLLDPNYGTQESMIDNLVKLAVDVIFYMECDYNLKNGIKIKRIDFLKN